MKYTTGSKDFDVFKRIYGPPRSQQCSKQTSSGWDIEGFDMLRVSSKVRVKVCGKVERQRSRKKMKQMVKRSKREKKWTGMLTPGSGFSSRMGSLNDPQKNQTSPTNQTIRLSPLHATTSTFTSFVRSTL